MTITREQLRDLRDSLRKDANSRAHSASIGRAFNEAATALDQADAVLFREGIETIWDDGCSPGPAEDAGQEK